MSQNKDQNPALLQLQDVASTIDTATAMDAQKLSDLKLIMTNSAFGIEYANLALETEGEYSIISDKLNIDIDQFKNDSYLGIRIPA